MEDEIVGTLTLFDLFVRFVPGVILLSIAIVLGLVQAPKDAETLRQIPDMIWLILFVSAAYALGAVLRLPATLISKIARKRAFGVANPRKVYTKSNKDGKPLVVRDKGTLQLAQKMSKEVCDEFGIDSDGTAFAFGYMINYLEVHGAAGKEDSMSGLVDFCTSMAAVVIISLGLHAISIGLGLCEMTLLTGFAEACFGIILVLCCVNPSIMYEKMRFTIVVRTFAALRSRESVGADQKR